MPQFEVSTFPSQIFWLGIVFSLLYIFVSMVISPSVSKAISARSLFIKSNIEEAEKINTKIIEIKKNKEADLQQIGATIKQEESVLLQGIEESFNQNMQKMLAEFANDRKKAMIEFDQDSQKFKSQAMNAEIDVASLIIEKITNKQPDADLLLAIANKTNTKIHQQN